MDLGVLTKHGRIRHPQTQGKDERFNGTLLKERLKYREYDDFFHAQTDFNEYRDFYNNERPHHALNLETPSTRYAESEKRLHQCTGTWKYDNKFEVKPVKKSGYITFNRQGYFLSEAFGGKDVGLVESRSRKGLFHIVYRNFCVAKLNVDNRHVLAKRAFKWEYNVSDDDASRR
jgi:hypothetical protein